MSILSGRPQLTPLCLLLILCLGAAAGERKAPDEQAKRYRAWVEEMKQAPRGPFRRIRWFCADGSILPPKAFACKDHGGGVQHGELSDRAKALREAGYRVGNVLADLDVETFVGEAGHRDALVQILVEQFLVQADDGWILRKARFYRGAFQEQDERAAAGRLLEALSASDRHVRRDFTLLRTAARLLPHGADARSAGLVRQLSAALSDRDPGFLQLRNKIHGQPHPGDAAEVRRYAEKITEAGLAADMERLAAAIDELYATAPPAQTLRALARRARGEPALAALAEEQARRLEAATDDLQRYLTLGETLAALRQALPGIARADVRLATLDASLVLESSTFITTANLTDRFAAADRAGRIALLAAGNDAAYGTGLISERQLEALRGSLAALRDPRPSLARYKGELDYQSLLPAWATQRLRFHFATGMERLAEIEPKAVHFIEDQLRGSPLFFHAKVLDSMLRDANRLAGVRNELFGENVGAGLRALNPGLARGRLLPLPQHSDGFAADGIYVLPETTADLPPVAGILTAGEGNPLSHIQLLARNLGIPNVGIDDSLQGAVTPRHGRTVILAVSPAGSVQLNEDTGQGDALFSGPAKPEEQVLIRPDLDKLDVSETRLLSLSDLRASDSGRTVGPKAAKLGELKRSFPEAVEEGLAIPFGVFRGMLEQPYRDSGKSVFRWMQENYRRLETMPADSPGRQRETEAFREALYQWVLAADPGAAFKEALRRRMGEVFGSDGSYGVFVRSDTNVEDLPGFTGAGLNLTVANVVGVDAVTRALSRVWASPFTARAFAWRQAHMQGPEHVYPAILLLKSVNADKSGVLVTQDIDTGAAGWLSVAVNEGVGGAVDGQAAESLRIHVDSARVRLLAQATAPLRRQVSTAGGVDRLPASGDDTVLTEAEIARLIALYRVLPERFPAIVDVDGKAAPADIEFGFLDGKLKLFQIRPFLESRRARGNAYLASLDAALTSLDGIRVDMSEVPR